MSLGRVCTKGCCYQQSGLGNFLAFGTTHTPFIFCGTGCIEFVSSNRAFVAKHSRLTPLYVFFYGPAVREVSSSPSADSHFSPFLLTHLTTSECALGPNRHNKCQGSIVNLSFASPLTPRSFAPHQTRIKGPFAHRKRSGQIFGQYSVVREKWPCTSFQNFQRYLWRSLKWSFF